MSNEFTNAYEAELKAQHGVAVIYEDRGIIEMQSVSVDTQPCGATDYKLSHDCTEIGVYRVSGYYKDRRKGARSKQFHRHLCAIHLAEWAAFHGTTGAALLAKEADE